MLVPEIALTPQTAGRFVERFGDAVAIMHSQLTARERYDEWWRMRRGEARVCVGPRSAVFAPFEDLGLIVVDEEHDSSYKQEGDPRYDARVVAERRAELEGALLLAGSATPRPESQVRYERLELRERVDGRAPAAGRAGRDGAASRGRCTSARARSSTASGAAARRRSCCSTGAAGPTSSPAACAGACGSAPTATSRWCCTTPPASWPATTAGTARAVPSECPDCGSVAVARHGAGTEQLERELEAVVSPLPVFRLDSDVAASSGIEGVLRAFESAEAGVLVGTQMVAKGHDFPDVTLGVVLDADATLRFPDFRAEERTFALVAQLAGRSGRGRRGGRVIVQALEPQARALTHAAGHDATGFLADELPRREAFAYPPYGHLIRVVCSARAGGPRARRRDGRPRAASTRPACRSWARRRCSGARRATAPSS